MAWRHGRGVGRVAALVLCCLLAADEDAAARRAHRARLGRGVGRVAALVLCCLLAADEDAAARRAHRARPQSPPAEKPEFTGRPNPPGPIRFADMRIEPVAWSELDGWAGDD